MDFAFPPEAEKFRRTLRRWLDENLEARFRNVVEGLASGEERIALLREWNAKLADADRQRCVQAAPVTVE